MEPSASSSSSADRPLPRYGEAVEELSARLSSIGALATIVVSCGALAGVERVYGVKARDRVVATVADAIVAATAGQRGEHDRVLLADEGWDEISICLFRPRDDVEFYREGIGALAHTVADQLGKQAGRLLYPYLRAGASFQVGSALTVFNPIVSSVRQVRNALRDARIDASLQAELAARSRRRSFQQILIAEDVSILFEPIVNLSTRDVLGHEALARGPAGSAVQNPGAFFGVAEESGLLFEADSLCRRRALEEARGLAPGKKLFLNCLPSAIRDPNFHGATLRKNLDQLRLRPTDVVFEISERESISNFAIFREARDHFASMGLGIALDDTGVGYSSLEAVMELAPDFIKVDQSLVRSIDTDPPRQELLRSLNAVAGKLGARVIAEGIETSEELATLQGLGVPLGQGYLLGRAAPLRRER